MIGSAGSVLSGAKRPSAAPLLRLVWWCQRDRYTFVPGIVEGNVEHFRLTSKGVKHHDDCIGLILCHTPYSFDEVSSVMLTEIDFTVFLIGW